MPGFTALRSYFAVKKGLKHFWLDLKNGQVANLDAIALRQGT
jgi:hypothetical protein